MFRNRLAVRAMTCFAVLASFSTPGFAQSNGKLSSSYIPSDAIVAAFARPREILLDEQMELLPLEVLQAFGNHQLGFDPLTIESVKTVAGMPSPAGPMGGAVIEFSEDFDLAAVLQRIPGTFEPVTVDGLDMFHAPGERPTIHFYQPNSKTVLAGVGGYLPAMINAKSGSSGNLAELTSRINQRPGLMVIAVIEPIRNIVSPMLKQQVMMLPPKLRSVGDLADQSDAILVNVNYIYPQSQFAVTLLGRDEASAKAIAETLNQCIDFGREMAINNVADKTQSDDQVQLEMLNYTKRVSDLIAERLRPQVSGKFVQIKDDGALLGTGTLLGILLPAMEGARSAARNLGVASQMKQIGLAIHNYYATQNKLPFNAIASDDGTPLLSWRVAILPYIDQMGLYQQFHLDEPWDSAHNRALVDQMPEVFASPRRTLKRGETAFLAPAGTGMISEPGRTTSFYDITDGTSNTIMVVEASDEAAVPWTKPADLPTEGTDLRSMLSIGPGERGFQVLFGDGSVRSLPQTISAEDLKGLMTRDGREALNY